MNPARILVTGGATNIGLAITEAFVAAGARVAVGQPDPAVAEPLVRRHGGQIVALPLEASDPRLCARFVEEAASALGGVDALINNAAITGPEASRAAADVDGAYFNRLFAVNVGGVFFCSQAAAPHLRRSGGGVIVNITSINAFRPQRGAAIYAATKAAVGSLTQSLAKELAGDGIRVVAVAPGDIATPETARTTRHLQSKGLPSDVAGQTPLGRGAPKDIGSVVAFLCSPAAGFVTGTTWLVDGGLLA